MVIRHLQKYNAINYLLRKHFKQYFILFQCSVALKSGKNKMSVFNLGVVFGPTLLRSVEETLASILDIKFNNVVIEMLIENYEAVFKNSPGNTSDYM